MELVALDVQALMGKAFSSKQCAVGRHTCWHHGCEHTEECAKEKEGAVVVSLRRLVSDAPVQPAYHEPESTQV